MNLFLGANFGVNWSVFLVFLIQIAFFVLVVSLVFRAVRLVVRAVTAAEKSAKAQQDTVYLLREIATLLKSNKENKQP